MENLVSFDQYPYCFPVGAEGGKVPNLTTLRWSSLLDVLNISKLNAL